MRLLYMQNYYLHRQLAQSSSIRNLQMYRYDQGKSYLVGSRGNCVEMYRLFQGELSFVDRFTFHARICRLEVIPSRHHKYDYLVVVDVKGRFCVWHQGGCDYVENAIVWEEGSKEGIYSGVSYQFEEKDTVGVVFFSNGVELVLVQFGVSLRGVSIDANSIIKYSMPASEIRHIGWIKHSDSIFLLGMIFQQGQKTIFSVYNLQKGLGICEQSLQWNLQKINLLQFYSQNSGQILIMTYHQISLHRYKNHYPLKNYRTRGNYGQGFILDNEFYGHVGEQFILFSKEKLKTYGQIRQKNAVVFDNLAYSKVLDEKTVLLQSYIGGTYLLYIGKQTFQLIEIFQQIGQILQIEPLDEGNKFITVNQCQDHFSVNILQPQLLIPFQMQQLIQLQKIQRVFSIKGGIFIILCSQNLNQVHRLNKGNIYEFYVEIPSGNILAAQENFIVYEDGIYQADYQSQTLTKIVQKQMIMAQIVQQNIYFLTSEGYLLRLNEEGDEQMILQGRQSDYCWGKTIESNTLLTANLSQNRQITLINSLKPKHLSIKGHTLVSCMGSIQTGNKRSNNDRILIGYVDGQLHVHDVQLFHSILILDVIANSPPKFCIVSNQSIIAYYGNKQILLTSVENQIKSINLSINISNQPIHLIHYINKSQLLCYIKQQQIDKRSILRHGSFPKTFQTLVFHRSLSPAMKLDEWSTTIPLLKKIDDRLLVVGAKQLKLYRLQNGKIIKRMKHILQQVISIIIIKLGILLCGVSEEKQMMLLISQDLQIKAQFTLSSIKPLRKMRNCVEDNQFIVGYSDYIAIYKITGALQLVSIIGSKVDLQSCQIDICQTLILVNDPLKKLLIYKMDETISLFGGYLPAYMLTDSMFLQGDMITIDERGTFIAYSLQKQQSFERLKFSRIFSLNVSDSITTTNKQKNQLFYASQDGKIGMIQTIHRQQFDRFKKAESITLSSSETQAFSYWQWRSRSSLPERLIDYPIQNNRQDSFFILRN